MLKMPRPSNDLKKPTFSRTESTLNSVAKRITPNSLNESIWYIMKIGENIIKNLPAKMLLTAKKIVPDIPKATIAILKLEWSHTK